MRRCIHFGPVVLVVWTLTGFAFGQPQPESEQPPASDPTPPATVLEDRPEPFVPKQARSEAERDRIKALSLFAAGRMSQQKEDYRTALRLYQRALRHDPDAMPILREIVPLAFTLDRHAEAVRYALLAAEREPTDPMLLRRLALYLTEENDWERALKLYETAEKLQANEKPTSSAVLLWTEMGRLYFLTGKHTEAAEHFGRVVKALDKPDEYGLDESLRKAILDSPDLTYQLFGQSFLEAGQLEAAEAAFRKAHELKPNEGALNYHLARIAARKKQPAEALAQLQKFFDSRQSNQGTEPYALLTELLNELGQSDQLLGKLEKLVENDPENVLLRYYLATQYQKAKQFDKAVENYRRLLEKPGKGPPLEAFRGLIAIYHETKQLEPLLEVLGSAVNRTGSLGNLGEEGKVLLAEAEVVKSVVQTAQTQKQADPQKLDYGTALAAGLLAIEDKQYDLAGEFFELALAKEPKKKAETLLSWGLELFMAEQYSPAAKVFQRGIDEAVLPADNPALHFYLASALEMNGQTDAALAAAQVAADAQPDSPRIASRVAWILYHAKRHEEAKKRYQALIDKFDSIHDSTEVREVMRDARLVLSNLNVLENNLPAAEEWLEQVLDEFPEDVGASNDLGYLWADQGKNLERALRMIERAVAAEPENKAYRDSLGWVYFRLGRYPEAVAELKTAANLPDPDGVILDHLGDALAKTDDRAEAIEAWQKAVKAFEAEGETEKAAQTQEKINRTTAEGDNEKS